MEKTAIGLLTPNCAPEGSRLAQPLWELPVLGGSAWVEWQQVSDMLQVLSKPEEEGKGYHAKY